MKDQRTSIFTIERRKNFSESFTKFYEDLQTLVNTSSGVKYKIIDYLNYCIRYWPHRCGATGLDDYMREIGVDITHAEENKDLLLILELLINLLHWAPKQNTNDCSGFDISFIKNEVKNEAERLIENTEYLLEQCCNMTVREVDDDEFPKYYITKRSAQVDAAVEMVPDLSDVLLGYWDIRNADDSAYKEKALIAIYGYLEPKRKGYNGTSCSTICEEFFACMNSFGIRHKTKNQVGINYVERNDIYDKLFYMALYVLQSENVNEFKDEMKALRESSKSKGQSQ